jgi:hypothetical protein
MKKPKLSSAGSDSSDRDPREPEGLDCRHDAEGQRTSEDRLPPEGRTTTVVPRSRQDGSYYLRRGWDRLVCSVYLIRVLDYLRDGYREGGEGFLSNLALVWVSRDGSRESALKGAALRELAESKRKPA